MKISIDNLIIFFLLFFSITASIHSQTLKERRGCEPVVIQHAPLGSFFNIPVNEIYLYAYFDDTETWAMMPFQVDEIAYVPDPFYLPDTVLRYTYFLPDDSLLDSNDELVFLVADLGDKAPDDIWINNVESRTYPRLEIKINSEDDTTDAAYGYLYQSSTITEPVPAPYNFSYDINDQMLENINYAIGFNHDNGVIEDIVIKPPHGSGVDIFDTQKLRFAGLMDLGGGVIITIGRSGNPAANEQDNLYLYNENDGEYYYHEVTPNPVVRMVREVRQTIKFGYIKLNDIAFYVESKYYPFSSTMEGGASLDPDTLKILFDTDEEIYIELDILRQSWDFNEAATGMSFYNKYNQNVLVDGNPDTVDMTIDIPIREWNLTTGNQGSVFFHTAFQDTGWESIDLYYYDNSEGGQGDGTTGSDTGDTLSYGDQGIFFSNLSQRSASLDLGFTAYFLEANLDNSRGEDLAEQVEHPVLYQTTTQLDQTGVENNRGTTPIRFKLHQNHPNPFNSTTAISFSLPIEDRIMIVIFNTNGRHVLTLTEKTYTAGTHYITWDGTDSANNPVTTGIYYCRIQSKNKSETKKLILLR